MSSLPCHAGTASFFSAPLQDFEAKRAHVLKHLARSERLTEVRPASRLEVRPRPEMLSTGIPQIDALTSGIPRSCMSEIYGSASSGKTSVLLATLAVATRRDESCALIDAGDSFNPESGQTAGVDFGKLLWVRCGICRKSSSIVHRPSSACRKADDQRPTTKDSVQDNELRLEQVLKTTDLILQSGGFGLVALDLAGIDEKFVRRIPLASWFRFQRAVEHTKTALLVVAEFRCAESCAAIILKCSRNQGCPTLISPFFEEIGWVSPNPLPSPAHAQLLENMNVQAELVRSRLERKPMQSVKADFATRSVRAGS